jgi:hypothetical protein
MKSTYTTSAQKTLNFPAEETLKKLSSQISEITGLTFNLTKRENILESNLFDGSCLILASFKTEDGRSIAMIDHKNVPNDIDRSFQQRKWRQLLDHIFEPKI